MNYLKIALLAFLPALAGADLHAQHRSYLSAGAAVTTLSGDFSSPLPLPTVGVQVYAPAASAVAFTPGARYTQRGQAAGDEGALVRSHSLQLEIGLAYRGWKNIMGGVGFFHAIRLGGTAPLGESEGMTDDLGLFAQAGYQLRRWGVVARYERGMVDVVHNAGRKVRTQTAGLSLLWLVAE